MSVSHFEVIRRTPFAYDYERVDGKLHFDVDPGDPANTRIVDLDKAARDGAGRVRFWADFVLLQPADRERLLRSFPRAQAGQRQIRLSVLDAKGDWRDALTGLLDRLVA